MADKVLHHVGRLNNTDRRCVIVYPQNPHNPAMALVVDTDALPPRLHDALISVVEGEGQSSPTLASVLQRRLFTDTGVDLMNTLFQANVLQSVPIDMVTLYPRPNAPIPLAMVVNNSLHQTMDHNAVSQTPPMDRSPYHDRMAESVAPQADLQTKYNQYLANQSTNRAEEQVATAQAMLIEAEDLVRVAATKREAAFRMAPSLRPVTAATAVSTETVIDPTVGLNAGQSIVGQPAPVAAPVAAPVVGQAAPVAASVADLVAASAPDPIATSTTAAVIDASVSEPAPESKARKAKKAE